MIEPFVEPKYQRLRDALVARAVPGQALPSERELTVEYGVSRATVRKAIDTLVADGLLHRVPGVGTFAVPPRLDTRLHLASFTQDMRRRGRRPSSRTIALAAAVPPAVVREALRLEPGATAWRLERLRLADGDPMAVEVGWYPTAIAPALDRDDLDGGVYHLLSQRYGLVIDSAEQTIAAEPADAALAARLGVAGGAPVLVFTRVSEAAGRRVEQVVSHYRADRYQLHMSLSADGLAAGRQPQE